jgi:membrane protein
MVAVSTPPPIQGEVTDPPPKETPDKVRELDSRTGHTGLIVGVGYRSFARFSHAKTTLLAAGTTYYLFLAMFSIIAFGYGLAGILGADRIAAYLTEALSEAFPGLLGDQGIDPEQLRAVGSATSIIGLIGLLYGGSGGVIAARRSVHIIFGAPKDPRNFVIARIRSLVVLVLIGPLILVSFVATTLTSNVADNLLKTLDIEWTGPGILLNVTSLVLTLGVNFLIVYILLGILGGIRPPRGARMIGSAVGAVVTEVLKSLMALLIGFTIDKPQYGAFAAPIGIMFVLFLLCLALYGSASLTAGVADRDVPLDVLEPTDVEEAQADIEEAQAEAEAESEAEGEAAAEESQHGG